MKKLFLTTALIGAAPSSTAWARARAMVSGSTMDSRRKRALASCSLMTCLSLRAWLMCPGYSLTARRARRRGGSLVT